MDPRSNRNYNLAIAAIIETGAILRLWGLGILQLWYDECFTLLAAKLDLAGMVRATLYDVHPPLHYLMEWIIIRILGPYNWAMRLPSAIFSIGALFLAWKLAERMKISRSGILAGMIFLALNPVAIWYAQEARMYDLLQLLVLVQALALLDRRWLVLGIATTISLWLHNYGLIYLASIGLLGLFLYIPRKKNEEIPVGFVLSLLIPVILYLPWLPALKIQMDAVGESYWIAPVNLGTMIYDLSGIFWGIVTKAPWDSLTVLIFVGMFSLAVIRSLQHKENGVLWWLALAPVLIATLISILWTPILLFRGLIGCVIPLIFILAERLMGEKQSQINKVMAAVILVPVIIASQFNLWMDHTDTKGMDKQIIRTYIRPDWKSTDGILHLNDGTAVIFFAMAPDLPQYELKSPCRAPVGALSDQTRLALGIQQISLEEAQQKFGRVWLVAGLGSTSGKCEEELMNQLTDNRNPVYFTSSQYMKAGVWIYDNSKGLH